ncbi:MAG TPA: hypothetical protein VES67_08370 [Vicinamibacterales bacterium]|nr:hypothetical protein [Vicinamibacterales bacterium]
MNIAMKRMMIAGGLALVIGGTAIPLAQTSPAWVVGDVFVAIGRGQYEVRSNAGALKQTITIGLGLQKKEVAGCWFDSQFNLYTADFNNTKVVKHELAGSHAQSIFADTAVAAPDGHSESIVMAVNGDVFVGHAGNANGTGTRNIVRYRSTGGTAIATYSPVVENRGIDWMDLASDQRTMFYTSRGRLVKRFNATGTTGNQLSDFTTLPGTTPTNVAYAIRLLPPFDANASGGLLVADNATIKRLGANGAVAQTYDAAGENNWQALNLDPDGIHFWAGGFSSGKLYRFNISTGAVVGNPIQTGGANGLMGLCVMGEPQTQVFPLQLSNTGSTTTQQDVTAPFGDPAATSDSSYYSFSTWRLRIRVKPNQNVVAAVSFTPQTTDLNCTGTPDNDFDCRFTTASQTAATQCVPFFRDPSAPVAGNLDRYQCAYYRVKDMPICSASQPNNCPFDEEFVGGSLAGKDDILSEILMNLTNPPQLVFNVAQYGPAPKGNPRLMRDPDSVAGNQFFIDATTAVIDWPAFGTGTPNDYSPVQRVTSNPGACAEVISPDKSGLNSGAAIKVVVEVKTGPTVNGVCTGLPLDGTVTPPNNVTLAIAGTGTNHTVIIYCETPGNSLGCFTAVNGQPGRIQSTVDLDPATIPPDLANDYFFAVTSVNRPSANPGTQNPGVFPPVGRSYRICPNGSNCGS